MDEAELIIIIIIIIFVIKGNGFYGHEKRPVWGNFGSFRLVSGKYKVVTDYQKVLKNSCRKLIPLYLALKINYVYFKIIL